MDEFAPIFDETPDSLRERMLSQLRLLGAATAGAWERQMFRVVTGHRHDDVDWTFEQNQVGYALWIRTFGVTVAQLINEGAVLVDERNGKRILMARPVGPPS